MKWNYLSGEPLGLLQPNFVYRFFDMLYTMGLIFSLKFCLFVKLLKQKWNYCPGDMIWGEPLGLFRPNLVYWFFDMIYTMELIFSLKFCLFCELLKRKWSEIIFQENRWVFCNQTLYTGSLTCFILWNWFSVWNFVYFFSYYSESEITARVIWYEENRWVFFNQTLYTGSLTCFILWNWFLVWNFVYLLSY